MAERTRTWRYSIGMFGLSIPINMIRASMLLYYVDILGLNVVAYGAVMSVYAVIDATDNPVLGYLSDRTRTRFGRRRPWIVVGATILAAAFVGFFSAPGSLSGLGLVAWFAVFAILSEAADSMVSANYGALLPEAFPAERSRAAANSLRQGFQLVALVIAIALTPLLTTRVFGTETTTTGFRTTALIYAAIALTALLLMAFGVKENPDYRAERPPRFWSSIRDIVTERLFWSVGIASACYLIPMALLLAGCQLYVRYSLGRPVADALYLQAPVIVVAGIGLVVWTRIVRRRGAPAVWRLTFIILPLSFIPLALVQSLGGAIAAGCVIAVAWSGLMATNDLIQARLLDHDARRHAVHREGIYLSAFGVFGRITGALNGVALASLGWIFGYYSGDDPGPDPGGAFRFYVSVIPAGLALVGAVIANRTAIPEAGAHAIPGADEREAGAPAPADRGTS